MGRAIKEKALIGATESLEKLGNVLGPDAEKVSWVRAALKLESLTIAQLQAVQVLCKIVTRHLTPPVQDDTALEISLKYDGKMTWTAWLTYGPYDFHTGFSSADAVGKLYRAMRGETTEREKPITGHGKGGASLAGKKVE